MQIFWSTKNITDQIKKKNQNFLSLKFDEVNFTNVHVREGWVDQRKDTEKEKKKRRALHKREVLRKAAEF